jgi:hypothetical protein
MLAVFNLASAGQAQIFTETAIAESAPKAFAENSTQITERLSFPLEDGGGLDPVFHLPVNSAAELKEEQGGTNLLITQVSQDDVLPTEPVELPSTESTVSSPEDPNARLRIPPNFGEGFPIELPPMNVLIPCKRVA